MKPFRSRRINLKFKPCDNYWPKQYLFTGGFGDYESDNDGLVYPPAQTTESTTTSGTESSSSEDNSAAPYNPVIPATTQDSSSTESEFQLPDNSQDMPPAPAIPPPGVVGSYPIVTTDTTSDGLLVPAKNDSSEPSSTEPSFPSSETDSSYTSDQTSSAAASEEPEHSSSEEDPSYHSRAQPTQQTQMRLRQHPKQVQRTEPTFSKSKQKHDEELEQDVMAMLNASKSDTSIIDPNNYPFRSKIKAYSKMHPEKGTLTLPPIGRDRRLSKLEDLYRPTYSERPGAWQMDIMFGVETQYLIMININTRYLFVRQLLDKTGECVIWAFNSILQVADITNKFLVRTHNIDEQGNYLVSEEEIHKQEKYGTFAINYVKGDDEPAFIMLKNNYEYHESSPDEPEADREARLYRVSKMTKKPLYVIDKPGDPEDGLPFLMYRKHIKFSFVNEPYSFHNKMVDSVIRTIRNALGLNPYNMDLTANIDRVVETYNETPHSSLPLFYDETIGMKRNYTPMEMSMIPGLEWEYIRMKDQELKEVKDKLTEQRLHQYREGNVLKLYLDRGKTRRRFQKRRLNFEDIGIFIKYHNGNARCYVLNSGRGNRGDAKANGTKKGTGTDEIKDVPLFYTQKIAESVYALDDRIKRYFNIEHAIKRKEELKQQDEEEQTNPPTETEDTDSTTTTEETTESTTTTDSTENTTSEQTTPTESSPPEDNGATTEVPSDQQVAQDIANDTKNDFA